MACTSTLPSVHGNIEQHYSNIHILIFKRQVIICNTDKTKQEHHLLLQMRVGYHIVIFAQKQQRIQRQRCHR